jgi:arginyl-tRNA synthetase
MARLGIAYDLLPHESDILHLGFWRQAFEMLKACGAVRKESEGKNAGCWVMSLAASPEFADLDDPDKILVRSNGTVTYVGKDIAYQMWKFGLLGRDFLYKRFTWRPETPVYDLWATTSVDGAADAPSFGHAETVYNVIDTRQSYLQRVVAAGLRMAS